MIRFSARGAYLLLISKGRALIRNGAIEGHGTLNFRETENYAKQSFDVSLKTTKKTVERTCCPWIFPGQNEQPRNRRRKI